MEIKVDIRAVKVEVNNFVIVMEITNKLRAQLEINRRKIASYSSGETFV